MAGAPETGFKQRVKFDEAAAMSGPDLIFTPQPSLPATQDASQLELSVLTEQFRMPTVTDWTIPEAFLCLLLAAAVSDGHLAPEEQAEITALGQRSRALKALDAKTLGQINSEVTKRLRDRPRGLEEACQALPNDLRLPIFGHCVEIVLADGVLLQSEIEYLNKIMMYLDIAPADAQFLIKAMLIKNRV